MANIAMKRVKKEIKEVIKSEEVASGAINLMIINNCWMELQGQILGPPDTPYESGKFLLEIKVPETYPFNPPKVRFITKIWHPNVSSVTGAICLDILKDQWAAALTLRTVMLSVQALLSQAEPDDPQDAVVATQCKEFPDIYIRTATHWTNAYAGGQKVVEEYNKKVHQLVEMGVEEHKGRVALSMHNWDMDCAIDEIFS